MTKICSFCKRDLVLSDYCINKTQKDGLSTYCKQCKREYNKLYYETFKEEQKTRVKDWKSGRRKELNEFLSIVKIKCKYCNENDSCCLDFHHRNSDEKKFNISDLKQKLVNIEDIKKEIEKCDIVCSNCHRKIHAGRKL